MDKTPKAMQLQSQTTQWLTDCLGLMALTEQWHNIGAFQKMYTLAKSLVSVRYSPLHL